MDRNELESLTTLPYGGSKEWLESNGDKTQLYQIDGYVWGYIESDGWTKSGTQFLIVPNESQMTNAGGTEYLLRNGDEGIVYSYAEPSGDIGIPVYDSKPETANEGDIIAVGGRKYKASLTTKEEENYNDLAENFTVGRINSSGAVDSTATAATTCTDYIRVYANCVVRVKGFGALDDYNCALYKEDKTVINAQKPSSNTAIWGHSYDEASGIATLSLGAFSSGEYWMRASGILTGTTDDVIITVNEEIITTTVTVVTWTDIGEYVTPVEAGWNATGETYIIVDSLSFTPINTDIPVVYSADGYVYSYISGADWMQTSKYTPLEIKVDSTLSDTSTNAVQNKIVKAAIDYVEDKVTRNTNDIITLQNELEALGGGTTPETVTIPSYWESMVTSKTKTVKALQEVGGKNCVSFAWASDTHIPDNDGGRTNDIGKVMAKMLDNCEAPFAVITGDINTRASFATEEGLLTAQASMPVHLAPLWGTDRLLMALGNHDGCYGDSTGYYRKQFKPERMWQTFFRGQALDFRRVFSDDGLYFYIDNIAQKTRFIILNSNFGGTYSEDSNGLAVNNRFGTSCYGQAQLDWLANVALDMPEGYDAILFAHVPPNVTYTVDKAQFIGIVNAYCNKTTYSGNYTGVAGWTSNSISVDFTNAQGEIIAMFAGHVHGDSIDTTTLACPLVTILAAGASANDPYKETAPTRTSGTDTETLFDVVTINKTTRIIYCTRVGAGADREVSY